MKERVGIYYATGADKSANMEILIETILEKLDGEIVCEVYDLFDIKKIVKEKGLQYIFLSEKPDSFITFMNKAFETDIKAVVDVKTQSIMENSFLNRDTFRQALIHEWSEYIRNNRVLQSGNRVAIYHMVLDPVRKGCIDREMEVMRLYAKNVGWEVVAEYIDMTNAQTKKVEFQKMCENTDNFDIVLLKNAYYLNRKTPEFIKIRNELFSKQVAIYSMNEGWC